MGTVCTAGGQMSRYRCSKAPAYGGTSRPCDRHRSASRSAALSSWSAGLAPPKAWLTCGTPTHVRRRERTANSAHLVDASGPAATPAPAAAGRRPSGAPGRRRTGGGRRTGRGARAPRSPMPAQDLLPQEVGLGAGPTGGCRSPARRRSRAAGPSAARAQSTSWPAALEGLGQGHHRQHVPVSRRRRDQYAHAGTPCRHTERRLSSVGHPQARRQDSEAQLLGDLLEGGVGLGRAVGVDQRRARSGCRCSPARRSRRPRGAARCRRPRTRCPHGPAGCAAGGSSRTTGWSTW